MLLDHPVVCIVGPTASGKTDVAQAYACLRGGEVVSADSMQIYKGMDIGTGKIPVAERKVPHYGFDLVDPGTPYSAALFQDYARNVFHDIDSRGKTPVLAGGTGLYVRASIDDYSFPSGEQTPEENAVRARYSDFAREYGNQALWDKLDAVDPASAALIHPNNVKRVVRAFELIELEGKSYADQHAGFSVMSQFVPAVFFHLDVSPDILAVRIDKRVNSMLEAGLLEEIRRLMNDGFESALTSREAIGYKEFVPYLMADQPDPDMLHTAVGAVKQATRRYAKRQRTWWRNDARVIHIDADDGDIERIANSVDDVVRSIEARLGE